jgi:hypothetical protein
MDAPLLLYSSGNLNRARSTRLKADPSIMKPFRDLSSALSRRLREDR